MIAFPEDAARPGPAGRRADAGHRAAAARPAHPGAPVGRDEGRVSAQWTSRVMRAAVRRSSAPPPCAACCAGGAARRRPPSRARVRRDALPRSRVARLPKEGARGAASLIRARRPVPRTSATASSFGNRERLPAGAAARLLSRVHRADARRAQPRRAAYRLRRPAKRAPAACYYTADHYRSFARIRE